MSCNRQAVRNEGDTASSALPMKGKARTQVGRETMVVSLARALQVAAKQKEALVAAAICHMEPEAW
jgi:hypothetical protein